MAVRGRLRSGAAAALVVEPEYVCLVSADRAGRRHLRRFATRELVVVEELRLGSRSELQIVTGTTTVTLTDVDAGQAWSLCRELRTRISRCK